MGGDGRSTTLDAKCRLVLGLIASGHSYQQIVDGNDGITYVDVFAAAAEALSIIDAPSRTPDYITQARMKHPRAYEPWLPTEESELMDRIQSGEKV